MRKRVGLVALLVGVGLLCVGLLAGARPTWAGAGDGPFIVNSLLDADDALPGDGVCEILPGNGFCTLRAAMTEASAQLGADTIVISRTGIISVEKPLPIISETLTILGPGPDALSVSVVYTAGPETGPTLDMTWDPYSNNLYFISGLELRGNGVETMGVYNGTLVLDHVRVVHARPALSVLFSTTHVVVRHSAFLDNQFDTGGAIESWWANLLIVDSYFEGNRATFGSALYSTGPSLIRNTTFYSNVLESVAYPGGGTIVNLGGMSLINSTISGNRIVSGTTSGGTGLLSEAPLTLTNVTLADNVSLPGQGGGLRLFAADAYLRNTLIANNSGGDCVNTGGTVIDGGYNLVEDNGCGFTGGADPLLGPLADNGGPTPTHALLAGSPAIDAGNPAGCTDPFGLLLVVDQRGHQRSVDGDASPGARCDIGAFEFLSSVFNLPLRYYAPVMSAH